MQSQKVYDATVDVKNPVNFCSDFAHHLLVELKNLYEGRCYKGAYIVEVVRLLKSSKCEVSRTSVEADCTVDAQFVANVVTFSAWDILVGVAVREVQPMLVGEYDARGRAVVTTLASKANETLAIGQRPPMRAVAVRHPPLQDRAAVVATLLTCERAAPAWRVRGNFDAAARAELRPTFAAIEAELRRREALLADTEMASRFHFFESLLHSHAGSGEGWAEVETWPGGPPWRGPPAPVEPGPGVRSVLALVRRALDGEAAPAAGLWSRPLSLHRSGPLAAGLEAGAEAPEDWAAPLDASPAIAFGALLTNILTFLVAVRECAELYDGPLRDAHRNIWLAMAAAQAQ